ncbi:MAG TPA: hypothetical protein VHM28_01855 [Anaerolineales bacterium]|nr:hypothetical protein [Anaerolineales bacterium]
MSKTRVLQCLSLFAILLSACGPARFDPKPLPTSGAPQPLPTLADKWSVKLTQSGGFAGVMLTVEVSSDGTIKAEDTRSGKSVTQTLSPTQLNQLKDLISAAKISPNAAPYPGCADCFIFTLEINSNGTVSRVQVDDITAKDSGALELINALRQLRNAMLGVNY